MRLVAVIRGDAPGFSITGTIGILIVFLVMGCSLALLFAILYARRSARPRPGWWSLAGVALFACVVLLTPLRQELGGRPELLALFIPIGLLLGWAAAWLTLVISRSLPELGGGHPSVDRRHPDLEPVMGWSRVQETSFPAITSRSTNPNARESLE